uniref:Uncharacterized protein n=1 Tax=Onchocerca volvulus TaxID=6282 RepID=A0A8R1XNS5_ONCVO
MAELILLAEKVDEVPPAEYVKDILLGICDEDPKQSAIFYCTVCESNMFGECSKRTHTRRSNL